MAPQTDGKILVGGSFSGVGAIFRLKLARLNADGTLDESFDANLSGGSGGLKSIMVQKDGQILIAGSFTHVHGVERNGIARLNQNGTLDASFDPGTGATDNSLDPREVRSIALQPDGKVLVLGEFQLFAGQDRRRFARLHANGSLESTATFNPPGVGLATQVILQSDGKMILNSYYDGPGFDTRLTRLNANGTLDKSFFVPIIVGNSQVSISFPGMTVQPDGKILVYGNVWRYQQGISGAVRRGIMRLNRNGSWDLSFDKGRGPQNGSDANVTGFSLQTDGKMLFSGGFSAVATPTGTVAREGLARLLPDGNLDPSIFDSVTPPDGTHFSLAQTLDGGILLGAYGAFLFENHSGSESLKATSGSEVQWLRSGSLPEAEEVIFEVSTDDGATWDMLGNGTRMAGGWKLNGLSLPAAGKLRASGRILFVGLEGTGQGRVEKTVDFTVAPDIAVQADAGPDLVSGGTGIDFGLTPLDAPDTVVLTIRNDGNLPLTGLVLGKGGSHPDDFAHTPLAAPPLAPGASRSVTLTFTPGDLGTRAAQLSLASNDPDEAPFLIDLTGNGEPAPGFIGFEKALFAIEEDAGSAVLSLVRTQGTLGDVTLTVTTKNGTAKLDSDYSAAPADVLIPDGATTGTLTIPITSDPGAEPAETFTVTLSNPAPAGRLGAIKTATVRILDTTDTKIPTVTLATPPANAVLNDPALVSITGTAGDNQGVERVEVSLNGAMAVPTPLESPGNGTTRYAVSLMPVTGLNTLSITSHDFQGNVSKILTRQFTVARPLLVSLLGPAGSGTVSKGFAPQSYRKVGTAYAVTATPKAGHFFEGWTANDWTGTGVTYDTRHQKKLAFTMVEGLALTANFIVNPFPAVAGAYNGLVLPSLPTAPGVKANGFLTVTATTTGGFSGKLTLDGSTLPFSGTFDHDGLGRFGPQSATVAVLTRKGKPTVELSLQLGVPFGMTVTTAPPILKITGVTTVKDGPTILATSTFTADRAVFGSGKLVPAGYTPLGSGSTATGRYTVALPAVGLQVLALDGLTPLTADDYAQGTGHGFLTLTAKGSVSFSGVLADGTLLTASAPLSPDRRWPLFKQLYGKKGSLGGQVTFDTAAPDNDLSQPSCVWLRPQITGQHYYPDGWPAGIQVGLLGSLYQPQAGVSALPGLGPDDADGNAGLDFDQGGLGSPVPKTVFISPADKVTNKPADTTFKLSLNRATGQISGWFTHDDSTKPAFKGVLLTKGSGPAGLGWFLTKKPATSTGEGKSGSVVLAPQ